MRLNRGLFLGLGFALCAAGYPAGAQTVSPMISEYTGQAAGSFEVTNSGLTSSVVVLEPKSFSIDLDGTGEFRPLDPAVHLELSATSVRLEPKQTKPRIFYKVTAETPPPLWLCIYAAFSPLKKGEGVNVRILLPHTIYVYQKQALTKGSIAVGSVRYDESKHQVLCELTNTSAMAGRAASAEVTGAHASASIGGFPMLPHEKRLLAIEWTAEQQPRSLEIEFEHFSLKLPIAD